MDLGDSRPQQDTIRLWPTCSIFVIVIATLQIAGAAGSAVLAGTGRNANESQPAPTDELLTVESPDYAEDAPDAQCGVRAAYLALKSLGTKVSYKDLLRTEYIGSKYGSTLGELENAVKHFGAEAAAMARMSCEGLQEIDSPVILHVRKDIGAPEYNHWQLYMGHDGRAAKLYDASGRFQWVPWRELVARWDGTGLIVSDRPPKITALWIGSIATYVWYASFAVAIALTCDVVYHGVLTRLMIDRTTIAFRSGLESLSLLFMALLVSNVYRGAHISGYLSDEEAVAAIKEYNFYRDLQFPVIGTTEVAKLVDTPHAVFVDSRDFVAFTAGHINGAVNIPRASTPQQCKERLRKVPTDAMIIVYCQSRSCPYSQMVAAKLNKLGYANIHLFAEGWSAWTSSTLSSK